MALLSSDDKFLGEKVENYCSSSEEDDGDEPSNSAPISSRPVPKAGRGTAQTGPKGVIEDWKKYKRLQHEEREKKALRQEELIKKLSLTCDPDAEETAEDKKFLQMYNKKRILELQQKYAARWSGITFGKLKELTANNYVEEIETEKHFVTVIIHIYVDDISACEAMTGCLQVLAREYPRVKFCQIRASEAKVSDNFLNNGLPALLAYKNNTLLGSFIRVSDTLGEDFFALDVESYLKSYGILPDKDLFNGDDEEDVNDDAKDDTRSSSDDE